MFQLIVSGTFFNVNDQNIGPLSLSPSFPHLLISFSPSLSLSLYPTLTLSLSPFLLLPLSLRPSLPLSLSLYLPLFLYFSPSLFLYLSPLSLPGTRTCNACRHRACYTTTLVVIISYQGNQGYPGNQLLEFL